MISEVVAWFILQVLILQILLVEGLVAEILNIQQRVNVQVQSLVER